MVQGNHCAAVLLMAPPLDALDPFLGLDKSALRALLLGRRKALSPAEQVAKAQALCQWCTQSEAWQDAEHIAAYWPMHDAEIDPSPLIFQAIAAGKQCYLPVFEQPAVERLCFVAYQPGDPLVAQAMGFLAPQIHTSTPWVSAADLDLILLPLIAFDRKGQRLGRGAGHYDRTLADQYDAATHQARKTLDQDSRSHRPYLMGLAYDLQGIPQLPADPWDIPLDAVLTETGLQIF